MLKQDNISRTNTYDPMNANNNSNPTDSYKLTNVYLNWLTDQGISFTVGAENLFNTDYIDHLSGFNRVLSSTVPRGSRMYGRGINLFGRVQFQW